MRRQSPLGTFGIVTVGLAALFLLAAVVWPHMAGSFLRAFLVVLALIWVARRVVHTELPGRHLLDDWSPFDGAADPRRPDVPYGLYELEIDLRLADDPTRVRRALVPTPVREIVRGHAARRLAEGYGLDLTDPTHRDRIRRHLSEPTWELVAPRPDDAGKHAQLAGVHESVTLERLDTVLDDLEKL